MSNWHPKPLRPKDPNPLCTQDDSYVIKKSSDLTPIQRQRIQDGTPHTRGSQYRIQPTQATQITGPRLYIGDDVSKSISNDKESDPVPPNADEIVKSFLSKGHVAGHEEEEDTEKATPREAHLASRGLTGKEGLREVAQKTPSMKTPAAPKAAAPKAAAPKAAAPKASGGGVGAKIGAGIGKVAGTAGKVGGKVVGAAVGLANRAN